MTASPPSTASQQPAPVLSIFWHVFWMTVLVVAVKASYVAMAKFWNWATTPLDYVSWNYLQWTAAASQADAVFSLAAGLVAGGVLWSLRRRPRLAGALRNSFVALGLVFVVYAVISRQIFSYYNAPLTSHLLLLAGEPTKLWSSAASLISPWALVAIVVFPTAYLALARASENIERRTGRSFRLGVRASVVVVFSAWLALGLSLEKSSWFFAQDRYFHESPHAVFLHSLAVSASRNSSILGGTAYAAVDASDFRKVAKSPRNPIYPVRGQTASRAPNIVLIVLESVGARYLSVYGSRLGTTPSLLAEQDSFLIFDNYYAPVGWTAYSLLSMTMSLRPPMERYNEVSFRAATMQGASIAEVLAGAGYRTAFIGAGGPDWASPGFLEQAGFAEVLRSVDLPGATPISSWGVEDRVLFERMTSWVDEHAGEPFFLVGWTEQTHHPYTVAAGQVLVDVLDADHKKANPPLANYTSLIREVDSQIGKFLARLRERGIADNTIVIVTGDHGEAFGEVHGGKGHGFTVYDEEVRVPLIIWNPSMFRQAGRSATVGSHIDLAPTMLELVGLSAPEGWDGRSLFDNHRSERTYLFAAAWGQYLLGVRSGPWKYVYDARLGKEELYNVLEDPDELRDLSDAESARASELRRRLAAWLDVERQKGKQR